MSSQKAEKNTESPIPILGHFIDGKAVSDQRRTSNIFNPATGQITKEVSMAGGIRPHKSVRKLCLLSKDFWKSMRMKYVR